MSQTMDFRTDILPHRDRLYRLALGITLHTAEAEDIVQDTMLRAWERRAEWPEIQNISAWLTQICRNLALDRKKHSQYEANLSQSTSSSERLGPATSHSALSTPHLSETLEARESLNILAQLMAQLTPPQDDIIRLRDIEGLSYREIATELGLTEDQVRVYLHRARQKLREQYTQMQNYGLQ